MMSTFFKKNFILYGEITLKNLELNFVESCDKDSDVSLRYVKRNWRWKKMKNYNQYNPIQT